MHLYLVCQLTDSFCLSHSDKKMGIAIVPLLKAADDPGRAIPFEAYVIHKGLYRGLVKGRIEINWREEDQKRVNPILTPRRAPKALTGSYLPRPSGLAGARLSLVDHRSGQ